MKTKKVLGSILDTLDFCCRKADAKTLKFLAFAIGSQSGTTKKSIRTNILVQAHELQRLTNIRSQRGKLDITAIDMGLENFAFAKFSWRTDEDKPQLIQWTKLRLDGSFIDAQALKPSFVPKSMSLVGHKLTEVLTQTPPDIFVIERQRTRTMGSANIPDPIVKVNALEHILFAYLNAKKLYSQQTKGTKEPLDYLIESSDPRRMTDFWCKSIPIRRLLDDKFGEGSPKAQLKATSSTLTKMLKISLVKSQIMEQKLASEVQSVSRTDKNYRHSCHQIGPLRTFKVRK